MIPSWKQRFENRIAAFKGSPGGRVLFYDENGKCVNSRRAYPEDYKKLFQEELTTLFSRIETEVIGRNEEGLPVDDYFRNPEELTKLYKARKHRDIMRVELRQKLSSLKEQYLGKEEE